MPIYEYKCKECEEKVEYIQSFSDKPKRKCLFCGGRLEKQISLPGTPTFAGGGWAADGYSKAKAKDD